MIVKKGLKDATPWAREKAARALETWRESFGERAAILEYEGGLSREDAERKAFEIVGAPPGSERSEPERRAHPGQVTT